MRKLICKECHKENIIDAKYCIKCGNKFTDKEIKKAQRFTFVWFLKIIDKIKSIINLSIITGNKVFRVFLIFIVLFIGGLNFYTNGNKLKLVKSDNYIIKSYKDTYYIILNEEKTIVDLYVPSKTKYLEIELIDNNTSTTKEKIELDKKVELLSNDEDSYYLISGIKDKSKDTLKVKLVYEENN